jgi:tetratricopeptide (TPR) repeat protein
LKSKTYIIAGVISIIIISHFSIKSSSNNVFKIKVASLFYNYGLNNQNNKEFRKALELYNIALKINPKLVDAYSNRAVVRVHTSDLVGALSDLDTAIELCPDDPILYNARGIIKRDNDLDGALADHNYSININPKISGSFASRAIIKLRKGDLEGAINDCNQAVYLNETNSYAHATRALIREKNQDIEGAISDLNIAIKYDSKNPENYVYKGFLEARNKNYKEAIKNYKYAIQLDNKLASAYNSIAWLLATAADESIRDGATALKYSTKSCEITEWKNCNYIDTYAAACAETGNYDQAIKWEGKYLECNPNDFKAMQRFILYNNYHPFHESKK